MESNPFRVIPLLAIAHPIEEISFQVQGAFKKMAHVEADFQESQILALTLLDITCIRMLDFNMCLYKSVINS